MIHNVGMQDRLIRMTIGLFLFIMSLNAGIGSMWGAIITIVGLVAFVTGAISFCPAYKVAGLNTEKSE